MTDDRPTYVLVLRPEPGVDAIRSLRVGLKILKRRLGLKAVRVTEQPAQKAAAQTRWHPIGTGPAKTGRD